MCLTVFAGEFLLGLTVYSRYRRSPMDDLAVVLLLDAYMDKSTQHKFYFRSQRSANNAMLAQLNASHSNLQLQPNFPQQLDDVETQRVVLQYVTRPEFVGDLHLNQLLLHAESYGVSRNLTESFLRSLFQRLWLAGDIQYDLQSPSDGGLEIDLLLNMQESYGELVNDDDVGTDCTTLKPQISAFLNIAGARKFRAFLQHETVLKNSYRKPLAKFFVDRLLAEASQEVNVNDFLSQMNALSEQQWLAHRDGVFASKPAYRVTLEIQPESDDFVTTFLAIAITSGAILCFIGCTLFVFVKHREHVKAKAKVRVFLE
jgi:hypothetical protein